MTRKATDYSKGLIYTIRSRDSLYVGSTKNFTNRKNHHKSNIHNRNENLYKIIRENNGEWDMKPYKEFPCENSIQLKIEEQRVYRELNADLNMKSCGTGLALSEYKKQYYEQHRDEINKKVINKNY